MRQFWRRDHDDLEQQLRARRSEAPTSFVRLLAQRVGGVERWFRPRVRYVLVTVLGLAALAAGASAGALSEASTGVTNAVNVVVNLTPGVSASSASSSDDDDCDDDDDEDDDDCDDDPGEDQYSDRCGLPPRKQCHVDVKPTSIKVKEGNSGTKAVTFKATIAHNRKSDGSATFAWTTANGTALSTGSASIGNPDYIATSGSYTFPAGTGTMPGTITVLIKGDTKKEPDEKFYLDVTSLNATSTKIHGGSKHIEIVIENDDR